MSAVVTITITITVDGGAVAIKQTADGSPLGESAGTTDQPDGPGSALATLSDAAPEGRADILDVPPSTTPQTDEVGTSPVTPVPDEGVGAGTIQEAPAARLCGCEKCVAARTAAMPVTERYALGSMVPGWRYNCEICGNKRCPHHTDHTLACTGSNEPGQAGSSWENYPPIPPQDPIPAGDEPANAGGSHDGGLDHGEPAGSGTYSERPPAIATEQEAPAALEGEGCGPDLDVARTGQGVGIVPADADIITLAPCPAPPQPDGCSTGEGLALGLSDVQLTPEPGERDEPIALEPPKSESKLAPTPPLGAGGPSEARVAVIPESDGLDLPRFLDRRVVATAQKPSHRGCFDPVEGTQ